MGYDGLATWLSHLAPRTYLVRLPVRDSQLVQLASGSLDLSTVDVRGCDAFILRFKTSARSLWTQVPEPDWTGFLVPISWAGDYVLNGRLARPNTVFQLDGSQEYDVLAQDRDAITVGIRRHALSKAISALTGSDWSADPRGIATWDLPATNREQLKLILLGVCSRSRELDSDGFFHRMPPAVEAKLISDVASWMIETLDLESRNNAGTRGDEKIVRAAIDATRNEGFAALSIADLCKAAGVGKSNLYKAFAEVYGVSPGDYLYRKRLTAARERLLTRAATSVKQVAIDLGFFHSGQFAKAYQAMFGELPKETPKRHPPK